MCTTPRPRFLLCVATLLACATALCAREADRFEGRTPQQWSVEMAKSELARAGSKLEHTGASNAHWDYTSGFLADSLIRLGRTAGDKDIESAGERIVSSFILLDGTIATYKADALSLDSIEPGRALLEAYAAHPSEASRKALATLRAQLDRQPKTSEGAWWHKQRYPDQLWLDGVYMAGPFAAAYSRTFDDKAALQASVRDIVLADSHLYDESTGLYAHGWDEKHKQAWADPVTGRSPSFWGRADGWYAMAVVDVLADLPKDSADYAAVHAVLTRVAAGIARWQDPASGVWWQVMDQGNRQGNYLEATSSCMFVYSLAKAIRLGLLPRDLYLPVVKSGYAGILRQFVSNDASGRLSLTHCCQVAGLGYTSASGRARDGSFGYYVSEPVVDNDLKGIAPFILAGMEVQQVLAADVPALASGWAGYPEVLAGIQAPVFPNRDFPITDFGAKPGEDCSLAIRKAIEACHAAGGGRVVVPAGVWKTGAIHLLSNVNLHLDTGSTLAFSTDPKAYLPVVFTRWEGTECMSYSALIYAFGQENIAVTGDGVLDGGASNETWWSWKNGPQKAARNRLVQMGEEGKPVPERVFGEGSNLRPNFFQPYRCANVLIEGVRIVRSPMWELNPVLCSNVTVRGVKIDTRGPNNDGCDPEACVGVLIEKCEFNTGDDCIAIKSGRNNDGRRVGVPSERMVVRDCYMKDGHGGVVIGSEISGGARDVFVDNCRMDSPQLDRALRLKSNAQRGGVIENVFMRNTSVGQVAEAILTVDLLYEEGARGPFPPVIRNIQLDHVTSTASPRILWIAGFDGATIDGIRISNSQFEGVRSADMVVHAGTIVFDHVNIGSPEKHASLHTASKK